MEECYASLYANQVCGKKRMRDVRYFVIINY